MRDIAVALVVVAFVVADLVSDIVGLPTQKAHGWDACATIAVIAFVAYLFGTKG